jgi:hypothetical protein
LPAGTDAVVIARQGAKELAERDGLAGIQTALGELVNKVPGATVAADAPVDADAGSEAAEAAEPAGAAEAAGDRGEGSSS